MSNAACWAKLRERSTLLTNEQCLLDLDKRVQELEGRLAPAAASIAGRAGPASATPAATIETAQEIDPEPASPVEIDPVPVQQRLPEVHELDREGRCWAFRSTTHDPNGKAWILGTPVSLQLNRSWCTFSHWLPYWSLPIVEEPIDTEDAS